MFGSLVSVQTVDAETSQDYDGLDELLECVNSISLLPDEEDFLPPVVLVSEFADATIPPPECWR